MSLRKQMDILLSHEKKAAVAAAAANAAATIAAAAAAPLAAAAAAPCEKVDKASTRARDTETLRGNLVDLIAVKRARCTVHGGVTCRRHISHTYTLKLALTVAASCDKPRESANIQQSYDLNSSPLSLLSSHGR